MKSVQDYISAARTLLQDLNEPYRYSDTVFKVALDISLDEAYRIRPDMFIGVAVMPSYVSLPNTAEPPIPRGYQSPFLYYICGHAQLSDQEDTTDARAGTFLAKFTAQLLQSAS